MNFAMSVPGIHLPDSISDLVLLQKEILFELQLKNGAFLDGNNELNFLEKQNNQLKTQIDRVYDMMMRLCSDKYPDPDSGIIDIA